MTYIFITYLQRSRSRTYVCRSPHVCIYMYQYIFIYTYTHVIYIHVTHLYITYLWHSRSRTHLWGRPCALTQSIRKIRFSAINSSYEQSSLERVRKKVTYNKGDNMGRPRECTNRSDFLWVKFVRLICVEQSSWARARLRMKSENVRWHRVYDPISSELRSWSYSSWQWVRESGLHRERILDQKVARWL